MQEISARNDTWAKQGTAAASTLSDPHKFAIKKGDRLQVKLLQPQGTHSLAILPVAIKGFYNWYIFNPHFELSTQQTLVDNATVEIVKGFEGCHEIIAGGNVKSYWDHLGGVWTIGYGHTANAQSGMILPMKAVENLLKGDLQIFANQVDGLLGLMPFNQRAALISFVYNQKSGIQALAGSSIRRSHQASNYMKAGNAFLLWNKSGEPLRPVAGLSRRRAAERDLYLGNDWKHWLNLGWEDKLMNLYPSAKAAGL
jgi:lysozyme